MVTIGRPDKRLEDSRTATVEALPPGIPDMSVVVGIRAAAINVERTANTVAGAKYIWSRG